MQPAAYNALSRLLYKPEVKDVYYRGKEIKLDGYKFVSCRFDGCTLLLTSNNFELDHCVIDDTTSIRYGEDVARPIKLFLGRYEWAYQLFDAYFVPTKNPDGTISIKG